MSCRVCLQRHKKMIPISFNHYLQNIIKHCLDIEIQTDNELPTGICHPCNEKLEEFSSFKNRSLVVNSILQSAKENGVLHLFTEETHSEEQSDSKNQIFIEIIANEEKDIQEEIVVKDEPAYYLENGSNLNKADNLMEICDSEDSQPFYCYVCRSDLETEENLLIHVKTHLPDWNKNWNNSKSMTEQVPNQENENVSKVKCTICSKEMLPQSLRKHLIRHTDRFKCELCSARFSEQVSLDIHFKGVHTDVKDTVCDICGKGFSNRGLLNTHLKSHSDIRKYKCKLCSYAGKTSAALRLHREVHVTEATYLCDLCPKAFRSNIRLNVHKRESHRKVRNFPCDQCDAKFSKNNALVDHYRAHSGERPFSCDLCDKTFTRKSVLREHKKRMHKKDNPKGLK